MRFIRAPDAELQDMEDLLDGVEAEPRAEQLEDAFMLLLRQHDGVREAESKAPIVAIEPEPGAAEDDEAVIHVRDLVRRFGDFTAVASTSFDVRRGEIFGLLGPNGAGKTTTFRMLCGLLPATSGTLEVAGVNLRRARAQARRRIGYVAQKFSLYANLTVRENLEFFGAPTVFAAPSCANG